MTAWHVAASWLSLPPPAWVALGVLLAAPLAVVGRRLPDRAERVGWIMGLFVVASAYVAFALARSAPPLATGFEIGGVALFTGVAGLGLRDRRWLAAAWLLHPVWDGLHTGFATAPGWYVWLCLGFDGVVGLSLLRGR